MQDQPQIPDLDYPNFEKLFKDQLKDLHVGDATVDGLEFSKKYLDTEDEFIELLHCTIVDPSQETKADLGKSIGLISPSHLPRSRPEPRNILRVRYAVREERICRSPRRLERLRVSLGKLTHFHSLSGGGRLVTTIGDNHNDVVRLLKELKHEKVFLFGHSMGGSILTSFLINNPDVKVAGLILSAPALGMNEELPPLIKYFAMNVVKHLKDFVFHSKISIGTISRKMSVMRQMMLSPWNVNGFGGPQLSFFCRLLYSFKYNAHLLKVPTFLHLGGNDVAINNDQCKIFFEKMTCQKRLKEHTHARHSLHTDASQSMYDSINEWMDELLENGCDDFTPAPADHKYCIGQLRIQEPLQHKGKMLLFAVVSYFLIGLLLIYLKLIYKKATHGKMLILWPKALWYGK